jgi:hypothetical protein
MASLNSSSGHSGYGTAPARERAGYLQERANAFTEPPIAPRHTGYGLPCAHCKTYYAADLPACPICKSPQRVSPSAPLPTSAPAEQLPDPEQLERERERFLQEMKAQVVASPLPQDWQTIAQYCTHVENHANSPEPASICQSCYDYLQERVDVLEAAMHIDLTDAAQIIYDAVWADPSDPSKTYANAAQALLSELRRRSGIPLVFGPLQPPVN